MSNKGTPPPKKKRTVKVRKIRKVRKVRKVQTSDTANVTISVPANMVSRLQNYMQELNLGTQQNLPNTEYITIEVDKILDHRSTRQTNGEWTFYIKFKNGTREWVNDVDCFCEEKITKYLSQNVVNVRTAYIICRVSTKSQTSCTSTSLDGQESEIRSALRAESRTFDRIKVYKISSSAYRGIPAVMLQIGKVLKQGDSLRVWRVDRLSRNIVAFLSWLEDLNKRGVSIIAHIEKLEYSSNRLEFIQKIVDAQKEAELIGQRIKLSYKRKRERGDEHVGGLSYGCKYQKVLNNDGAIRHKKVVPNKSEQDIIEKIKKSSLSNSKLAEKMNKENLLKRGKHWSKSMIFRIRKTFKKTSKRGWKYSK